MRALLCAAVLMLATGCMQETAATPQPTPATPTAAAPTTAPTPTATAARLPVSAQRQFTARVREGTEALVPIVTFLSTPATEEGADWKELLVEATNGYESAIIAFSEATKIALDAGEPVCANAIADCHSTLVGYSSQVFEMFPESAASGLPIPQAFGRVFHDTMREIRVQLPVLQTSCAAILVQEQQ